MYLDFYRLKQVPFHITPDPHFLFLSPSHKSALGALIYGIDERQGFVAITGEVGLGKTTIMRAYLERVDVRQLRAICILNANISFPDLLKTIYQAFGLACPADDPFTLVDQLHKVFVNEYQQGRNVALFIDEAQNMPIETLESLRMLSNLETATQKLLQIVLIGQPELDHKLKLHELRQLKQRIVVHVTLSPLTDEESRAYVQHRLERTTLTDEPIFTGQALKMLLKAAQGTPRVLNTLLTNALIAGYGCQQKPVSGKIARDVIADIQGTGPTSPQRRQLVYVLVVFILLGLFWFSPYRDLVLAQVKNFDALSTLFSPRLPQDDASVSFDKPRQDAPLSVDSVLPVVFTTGTSQVQVPVEAMPRDGLSDVVDIAKEMEEVNNLRGEEETPPPPPPFPRTALLRQGNSISKMALEMYGFVDAALIERIRQANPHVKNMNRVVVGEEILFPALPPTPE